MPRFRSEFMQSPDVWNGRQFTRESEKIIPSEAASI